jgi:arginyl-tRNA synthetase
MRGSSPRHLRVSATGETRASRLQLCQLTADTLRTGLGLLGIEVPEAM